MSVTPEQYLIRYAELRGKIKRLSRELTSLDVCERFTLAECETCIDTYRQSPGRSGKWPWLSEWLRSYNQDTGQYEVDHRLDPDADLCPNCIEALRLIRERRAVKRTLGATMAAMCRKGQALGEAKA